MTKKKLILIFFIFTNLFTQISLSTKIVLEEVNNKYKLIPHIGLEYLSDFLKVETEFYFFKNSNFNIANSFNFLDVEEVADQIKLQNLKILPDTYQLNKIFKGQIRYKLFEKTHVNLKSEIYKEEFVDNEPVIRVLDNDNLFVLYDRTTDKNSYFLNQLGLEYQIQPFHFGVLKEFIINQNKSISISSYDQFRFIAGLVFKDYEFGFVSNEIFNTFKSSVKGFLLDQISLELLSSRKNNRHLNIKFGFEEKLEENLQINVSALINLHKEKIDKLQSYNNWLKERYYFSENSRKEFSFGLKYQFPKAKSIAVSVIESQLMHPEVFSGMEAFYLANPIMKLKVKNLEKEKVVSTIKITDSDGENVTLAETLTVPKSEEKDIHLFLAPEYLSEVKWSERKNLKIVLSSENTESKLLEFPLQFYKNNVWNGNINHYKYFIDYKNKNTKGRFSQEITKLKDDFKDDAFILSYLIKKYLRVIQYVTDPEFSHGYDEIRSIEKIFSEKRADCEDLVNLFSVIFSEFNYDIYLVRKKGAENIENHVYLLVDTHLKSEKYFLSGYNERMTLSLKSKNNETSIWLALELTEFRSGLARMLFVGKENYINQLNMLKKDDIVCLNCF